MVITLGLLKARPNRRGKEYRFEERTLGGTAGIKIIITIASMLLLSCNGSMHQAKKIVNIQFSITHQLDSMTFENKKFPTYEIEMQIKNETDSTFYFWTNLCTWFDNIIPSDKFQFYNQGCDNNYLSLIHIDSGKRILFQSRIVILDSPQINKEINIDYILINKNEINKTDDFSQFKNLIHKKIINHEDVLNGILEIK